MTKPRSVGLYGREVLNVLPFLKEDFERRGYSPRFQRDSVFTADQVNPAFEIVAVSGLRGPSRLVRDCYVARGVPVLVADAAHLRRDLKHHKVAVNEHHWLPPISCPDDRLSNLRIEISDDARGGEILICGQKGGDSQHPFTRQQIDQWARGVAVALRRVTRRKIAWRPHPLDGYPIGGVDRISWPGEESLASALSKAHAVVTYNSTAGLDALIAGVPVVAFGPAVYGELAECDVSFIDDLEVPSVEDRRALLARVAYTQWTVEECRDGECLDFLLPVLAGEDPFAGRGWAETQTGSSAGGVEDRGVAEEQRVSAGVFAPPLPPAVVSRLVAAGFGSREAVRVASDDALRAAIKGLGPGRLGILREYVGD